MFLYIRDFHLLNDLEVSTLSPPSHIINDRYLRSSCQFRCQDQRHKPQWRICVASPTSACASASMDWLLYDSVLYSWEIRRSSWFHCDDVIMGAMASQITSLTIVYSTVYSSADQRKHQSSASLAFVWGIHRGPVNSPHKWPVTR